MTGAGDVATYFSGKSYEWTSTGLTIEQYIRNKGEEGLAEEFKNDPSFKTVCEFANKASSIQMRSEIGKGLEEVAGTLFGIPLVGAADIVIGGIELACGKKFVGERLIKGGAIAVGAFILGALLSPKKK